MHPIRLKLKRKQMVKHYHLLVVYRKRMLFESIPQAAAIHGFELFPSTAGIDSSKLVTLVRISSSDNRWMDEKVNYYAQCEY